jgi:uncharacterized Zn-binding protein involved in type VI secretion
MKEGHFIGLNDRTSCGGKVLDGDTRVMMFGVAHACEGDRVTCGEDGETYRIVGGVLHVISHGKRVAGTLDSYSNCPCKAELIPSVLTATYQNKAGSAQPATKAANSPANPVANSFTNKPQVVDPKLADKVATPPGDLGGSKVCNHPDQMEALASYIAGEMNRNIKHPAVLKMKELLSYDSGAEARKFRSLPWYARLAGPPNFNGIEWTLKLQAMAIWTKQVGQNMEWDHKPSWRRCTTALSDTSKGITSTTTISGQIFTMGMLALQAGFQKVCYWMALALSRSSQTLRGRLPK